MQLIRLCGPSRKWLLKLKLQDIGHFSERSRIVPINLGHSGSVHERSPFTVFWEPRWKRKAKTKKISDYLFSLSAWWIGESLCYDTLPRRILTVCYQIHSLPFLCFLSGRLSAQHSFRFLLELVPNPTMFGWSGFCWQWDSQCSGPTKRSKGSVRMKFPEREGARGFRGSGKGNINWADWMVVWPWQHIVYNPHLAFI